MTGGFNIAASTATRGIADNKTWQISEDLTLVRGRHQLALGANVAYWTRCRRPGRTAAATGISTADVTGLGMSDFLLGRVAIFEQGDAGGVDLNQRIPGPYAQDTWRATERVTLNAGLRWEPYLRPADH